MATRKGELTEKQRRFADEYIRTGEITQSAINAGYSVKNAYVIGRETMDKPMVKDYIDKRLEELRKESIAEQDEILQFLTSILRGQTDEEILRGEGQGFQVKDRMEVSAKDRIKAAELLGKRYSMFTDKVEHSGNVDLELVIDYGGDDDGDSTEEEN